MLHILRQIAKTGIKTEPAPPPAEDIGVVARLQEADRAHARARADDSPGRRGLVQRLRARDPRARQSVLQHRRPRHQVRREPASRRPAAGDRAGVEAHGDRAEAHLRRDARSEARRRRRRLRLHRRHLRRELREPRPRRQRDSGRRRDSGLPADADGAAARHSRGDHPACARTAADGSDGGNT